MTEVTQADRDAAADIWRDYVAKPGECIVERQMRSGEMDGVGSMVQSFARHRKQAAAEERAKIVAWLKASGDVGHLSAAYAIEAGEHLK